MREKHKIWSLIMALIFAVTCVMPTGGSILADEMQLAPISLKSAPAITKTLSKGDTFMASITLNMLNGVEGKDLSKNVSYVEVAGSASKSSTPVQINEGTTKNEGVIILHDLKYNGKGNTVNVEIGYKDDTGTSYEPLKVSINLENTETVLDAASGLTLSTNIINVVAGETQQIAIVVKNDTKYRVEAGKMELEVKDKTSAKAITLKKKSFDIPELNKGEKKEFYVSVAIDKDVTRGIHELQATINGSSHTIKLKVDSNFMPPSLEVDVNNTTAFEENVAKAIQVSIKNVGHVAAKNVKLEIVPSEKVFVADGSNVRYVENIDSGKTQTIPVSLIVNDTSTYNLPVEMKLSYIDDLGETKTSSQFIYLSTKGSIAQKELGIVTTTEPTGLKKIGEEFSIGFKVSAPDGAKNVKLSVKGTEGIVSKSKSIFIEPKFDKGQAKSYMVNFVATQSVTTGTYPIEIVAEYSLNGKEVAIKQYATVSVENKKDEEGEEKGKGKPKVIVGTYSSNPVVVKAGEEFDLEIGFLNTNQTKTVKNLKANLTVKEQGENDTGSVFTPVNASNTFFIDSLTPEQMEIKNIRLYTIPSAKPKTYQITLEMEYEDDKGEAITATENFGIPVEQVTKLEVAEVRVESTEVGMPTELSATIYNTGKTSISNIRITTTGEGFDVQDNTMIIGALEKGNSKNYMPTIIPNQGGNLTGQIHIEYEDVTGQIKNLTHDFQMDVMESAPMEEMPGMEEMPPMEEEKPAKWPILLGVCLGIGIAAGITGIVMKKRARKLEEMDIDED